MFFLTMKIVGVIIKLLHVRFILHPMSGSVHVNWITQKIMFHFPLPCLITAKIPTLINKSMGCLHNLI